jgi:hypothetical protein
MRRSTLNRVLFLWGLLLVVAATDARAAEPLRFSVTGDNRGRSGFVSVLQQIALLPGGAGQFMISPGDEDPIAATREQLDAVFGKAFVWYPAVGNHEIPAKDVDNMKALRDYYDQRLQGKVAPGPPGTFQTTYSFDAGEVHIAIINQYWDGTTEAGGDATTLAGLVKPLRKWLAQDLASSRRPWKLVVGHEPLFPQPDKDWGTARHETGALQILSPAACKDFWNILETSGVAAYICGHTHGYNRYRPEGSKVWQIDTGMARGGKDWKYDTFIIATADEKTLKFDAYRNLKERGKFEVADTLTLSAAAASAPAAGQTPIAPAPAAPVPPKEPVKGAP